MTGQPSEQAERGAAIFILMFVVVVVGLCLYGAAAALVDAGDFASKCRDNGGYTVQSGRTGQLCVDQGGRIVGSWP